MINITDKHNCCGCAACVQVCLKQCISFKEDEEGFCYPFVTNDLCINCGLCEKVCPMLNQSEPRKPLKVFAAINPNEEIRMESSSGGIFTMLAEAIITEGGVVFGARFDRNWEVIHDYTETKEGLAAFRGSKYVQSRIGKSYKQVCEFLTEGRKVLFSGTPCQIAGLKTFLHKEYNNLLSVDVVCHGVPSPLVWRKYLNTINPNDEKITYVNLRDKSRGWSKYSYLIKTTNSTIFDDYAANSDYLTCFVSNLALRKSCYSCPAKKGSSNSDVTLADCWGIEDFNPSLNDNKGISAVTANTLKGMSILSDFDIQYTVVQYQNFVTNNLSYIDSSTEPKYRTLFWRLYPKVGLATTLKLIKEKEQPNVVVRSIIRLKSIVKKILIK